MSSQKCELLFDAGGGRWVIRFVSLSLCHGRLIAFRWYLPISLPFLLRRTMVPSTPAGEEAHTCVHVLCRAGTTPIDFFDLSTNLFVLLIFTCDLRDFLDLSTSRPSE